MNLRMFIYVWRFCKEGNLLHTYIAFWSYFKNWISTVSMLNTIYLQVQHVVWVQHLSLLAGPPHCCCTSLNPPSPPSWRATAASCFSTSLQQKHDEKHSQLHQQILTKHLQTYQPVLQRKYIPVRSQWGRSYVPSELFFLFREKNTVMGGQFSKGLFFAWEREYIPAPPVPSTNHNQDESSQNHDQYRHQNCCQCHI